MKKILTVIFILIFSTSAFANKNKNTWDYPLIDYQGWVIEGSKDHYKFQSNLREDKDVLKEFKNNKNTGISSYTNFGSCVGEIQSDLNAPKCYRSNDRWGSEYILDKLFSLDHSH